MLDARALIARPIKATYIDVEFLPRSTVYESICVARHPISLYSCHGRRNIHAGTAIIAWLRKGSRTSTSLVFARKVSSQAAVIPIGEDNRFGHPHQETPDTLTEVLSEERILITSIHVNTELVSDGSRLRMKTER